MKAKILFTSILIMLFACTAVFAATKQEQRNVSAFSRIDVGSAFKVYLTQDSNQSVVVEIDDEYINDVQTIVKNGTLIVSLKSSGNTNRNIEVMNVYISTPTFDEITASGAAKIITETAFSSSGTVSFDLSGAAKIEALTLTCKKLKVEQSGASRCSIKLAADEVDADISGAGNLKLSGKVDALTVEGSGAASVNVSDLQYNTSDIDMSAAARIRK